MVALYRISGMNAFQIFLLSYCSFASAFSLRIVDPALPVIATDLGVSLQVVAWLNSAYAFPYAVMLLILGPLCDVVGRRHMIVASLAILTIGLIISALSPNYYTLLFSRILVGAFAGAVIPAAMAYIGDKVEFDTRQLVLSRIMVASILGQLSGALFSGALAESTGWRTIFLISAVISLVALVTAFMHLARDPHCRHAMSLPGIIRGYETVFSNPLSRIVFMIVLIEGILIFGAFPFVAPMLQHSNGGSSIEAGFVIAAFGIGGLIYGTSAGNLLKMLTQRQMMLAGAFMAGISYTSIAWFSEYWSVAAALFLLAGFGFYMFHNTMQTHGSELAPAVRGSALALFASAFFLGQALGPVISGKITANLGYPSLFIVNGMLLLILGVTASRLRWDHLHASRRWDHY